MNKNLMYKVVLIFNLTEGSADEELRRSKEESSFPSMLTQQSGFIELELVKISDDKTMSIQTWKTEKHWQVALKNVIELQKEAFKGQARENILVSRDFFGGYIQVHRIADQVK